MKTLKQARLDAGLTQSQLAARAGLQSQAISNLERNVHGAERETLLALCKALEISPKEIEGVVVKKRNGKGTWTIDANPFPEF